MDKVKNTSKTKWLIALIAFAIVIIVGLIVTIAVLAATSLNVQSAINIIYKVPTGVKGSAKADYKIGANGEWTPMTNESGLDKIEFGEEAATSNLNPPDINLSAIDYYVTFRYTFSNSIYNDYLATVTYSDSADDDINIELTYSSDGENFSTASEPSYIVSKDSGYDGETDPETVYYVRAAIQKRNKNATLTGDLVWDLQANISQENMNFTLNDDGTAELSEFTDENATNVVVPRKIKIEPTARSVASGEYIVTSIGENAFANKTALTSVIMPPNLATIATKAFIGCSALTNVSMPKTTTYATDSFPIITTKYHAATYEGNIFNPYYTLKKANSTSIMSCNIHPDTKVIGDNAFSNCDSLTSIIIPNGVISIGNYAFQSSRLTSISIPNSVTSIGEYAFAYCFFDSITIPSSVTSIGSYAFYGNGYLTSINILNSVISIGYKAFDCENLQPSVTENNLKYLGNSDNPYLYLWKATSTDIASCEINTKCKIIGYQAFSNCSGLTSITIPNSVTIIGYQAFLGCRKLTSITIPNSVTSLGIYAFSDCSGLTSITIPNSVTSIGNSAFYNCSGLTSITIPNSVTSIDYYAFYNCSGLTSITIPNSVTSIGSSAFSGCSGITSITIPSSVTSISSIAFSYCDGLARIKVESGNAVYEDRGANAIIEKSTNTLILGCKNTLIPNSVTSIGNSAFFNCSGLTSITIPNSVTSIGGHAFQDCLELTSITIPNSVTSIGEYAFNCCRKLTSVSFESECQITLIDSHTFAVCGLTSIIIPASVTRIGDYAFSGCSGLTTVILEGDTRKSCSDYYIFNNPSPNLTSIYVKDELVESYKTATNWSTWADKIKPIREKPAE